MGETNDGVFSASGEQEVARAMTITLVPDGAIANNGELVVNYESSQIDTELNKDVDSITLGKPIDTAEGDLMLASIAVHKDGTTVTAPTGWTQIDQGQQDDTATLAVFYKLAGAAEVGPYTFTTTADGEEIAGSILRYTGVDQNNPIDTSGGAGGDGPTPTAPDVTTSYTNTKVVRIFAAAKDLDFGDYVNIPCTTSRVELSANDKVLLGISDVNQTAIGATGTGVFDIGTNKDWRAVTVVLTPLQVKLEIAKTTSTPTVDAGDPATYSVTVTNTGGATATDVEVTDTLPAGFTYAAGTVTTGPAVPAARSRTNGGTLPAFVGAMIFRRTISVTIDYTVNVAATTVAGTYTNSVVATSDETSSNTDSVDVTVRDADMAVTKAVDNEIPNEGDTVIFTVTATNNGLAGADNVVVTDTLPPGLTWVSTVPSAGSCSVPSGVTCELGSLASGASATVTITATVNAGLGDSAVLTNSATVNADQNDPDSTNDTATASVTTCPAGKIPNSVKVSTNEVDTDPDNNSDHICTEVTPKADVSGNVFNDANGLTDFTVNGTGIDDPSGTPLYATLVDGSNNVVQSVAVNPDGSYTFPDVDPGSYTVEIGTTQGTVGNSAPGASLPTGWVNTGDHTGAGAGNDGSPNGSQAITVAATDVTEVNFGIEQPPDSGTDTQPVQSNPGGTTSVPVPATAFSGTDPAPGTVASIRITAFPSNATSITINGTTYTSATFPPGGVTVPTNSSGEPTQAISVDPVDGVVTVNIPYAAIDNAGVEDATPGSVSLPFGTGIGTISGSVLEDTTGDDAGDTALKNVTVQLWQDTNSDGVPDTLYANTQTAADGSYSFSAVPEGDYVLVEIDPAGYSSISDIDTTDDSDTVPNSDTNNNQIPVTLTAGEADDDNNFVDNQPGNITGTIWLDVDGDGVNDTGEPGIGGVTVYLCATGVDPCDAGNADATAVTDANGDYTFPDLPPGDYQVQVDPAELTGGNWTVWMRRRAISAASGHDQPGPGRDRGGRFRLCARCRYRRGGRDRLVRCRWRRDPGSRRSGDPGRDRTAL